MLPKMSLFSSLAFAFSFRFLTVDSWTLLDARREDRIDLIRMIPRRLQLTIYFAAAKMLTFTLKRVRCDESRFPGRFVKG